MTLHNSVTKVLKHYIYLKHKFSILNQMKSKCVFMFVHSLILHVHLSLSLDGGFVI